MSKSGETARLRALAANRGFKLVSSRARKPGRRGYGRYGLKDASGKPLFGFGKKYLTATATEVEHFLAGEGEKAWKRSLAATRPRRRRTPPA